MSKKRKDKHILKLWQTAFIKSHAATIMFNQLQSIEVKVQYFGRQTLYHQNKLADKDQQEISSFVIMPNTTPKLIWNIIIIFMVLYTATIAPFRLAFVLDTKENQEKFSS